MDRVKKIDYGLKTKSVSTRLIISFFKYFLLTSMAFVFLHPFLYMIITSLKSSADLADATIKWIPSSFVFSNFKTAFEGLNYITGLKNSAIITIACTLGHIVSCSMAGYGMARFKFRGRTIALIVLIITIIVPVQVTITPTYITFAKMKLINNLLSVILPSFLGMGLKSGIYIFIFRQFYTGVPYELEEAARVDGCGPFKTFLNIILPISTPPILVNLILSVVWHWNDSYETIILLSQKTVRPLAGALPDLYDVLMAGASSAETWEKALLYNEAVVMAATALVVLPVLAVYMILQRRFIEGVERSGIVG